MRADAPEDSRQLPAIAERLNDLTGLGIKEMDEAGIDMRAPSHANPGLQKMDAELGALACVANDRLAQTVRAYPDRFAAFAAIPPLIRRPRPTSWKRGHATRLQGCADHGTINGAFFDDKRFWPIWERAAALDVPLYPHPTMPHPAGDRDVQQGLRAGLADDHARRLGLHTGAATQGVRMVLSGVFDAYPKPKIILGHLGQAAVPAVAHRHGFQA